MRRASYARINPPPATHFTELVDYKLLSTEPNLELLTMDVLPGEEKDGVDLGRVFLYKCDSKLMTQLAH